MIYFSHSFASHSYQTSVVRKLDSAIHGINHYLVDTCRY